MTMTEMMTATFARMEKLIAEDDGTFGVHSCGKTFDIEAVGQVHLTLRKVEGAQTYMVQHMRRDWQLNGKRIAAAKLQALVGA